MAGAVTPPPTVTGVSPATGAPAGGDTVTITGTNFATAAGKTTVKFGANAATGVTCSATTTCMATSPAGTGKVNVRVTVGGKTSAINTAKDSFTYTATTGSPTVTHINPSMGAAGITVTITGTGFNKTSGKTTVKFGSNAATGVVCTTLKSCTAVVPAGTGIVPVTVTVGGNTSGQTNADKFTYSTSGGGGPAVTGVSPASGSTAGGFVVTISGNGFSTTAGATTVKFGTVSATGVTCSSTSLCNANAPAHTAGIVDVTVTVGGQTSNDVAADEFTYNTPSATTGYDMVGSDGGVFVFGQSTGYYGSLPGLKISVNNIVGMVPSHDEKGYYLVGSDGGVFGFGDASYMGSLPLIGVTVDNIVGIEPIPGGQGYFLVGSDGGVFAFGHASYIQSLPGEGVHVNNIEGIAVTADAGGYWLVGTDGAVYSIGDAKYYGGANGATGTNLSASAPIVGIASTADGLGYWLVGKDGSVYAYGDALKYGAPATGTVGDVVSLVPTSDAKGYWIVGADGGIFNYGDAAYEGSLPGLKIAVTNIVGAVPVAAS
jgi:hypothetical protein